MDSISNVQISVVMPCYNGAPFLASSLRSLAEQSFAPHEVIVIDDGSTDDSAAIAEAFGPPVRVLRQANQGESVARNRGIAESQGTHVLFLDADDLLAPLALERLAAAVGSLMCAVAMMGFATFETDPDKASSVRKATAKRFFPEIIGGCFGPPHCWLAPKQLVAQVGGFTGSIQQFEDWDLWCRVALTGAPLVSVDYIGALYRRHAKSQSVTSPSIERSRGHVAVMENLSDGMLQQDDLLKAHGHDLFWATWTALHMGRKRGMPWPELEPLAANIERIVRCGPANVRDMRFARLIRWLGVRWADRLRTVIPTDVSPIRAPSN